MKGFGDTHNSKKKKNKNTNLSKEQIINQAINFHIQGKIQEASKNYKYLINQGIADHRVFSNYGLILQSLSKLQEAEVSTRKAIELNPEFANSYSNLGNILNDRGKLQEAELSYRKAIELNPNFANAYYNLGNILSNRGNLQEAEISYRKAIKLDPDFVNAYSSLGSILKDLGKLQEAELSARKAIELNPDFAEGHSNLGNILKDLGNLQEAELSARKAIELNPDFAEAYYNLGVILTDLGNLQEAELSTRKAIQLDPHFANAHSNLGNILKDLGNLEEAELSTRKAIQLNPNHAIAYSNLGNILTDLDNLEEAELSTRKAIQLDPHFAEAHSNLGCILRDLGNLEDAEKSTLKAIQLNPDFAIAYFSLSNLRPSKKNKLWRNQLFSKNLLNKQLEKDKVSIFFARANICHKESNFKESYKYLQLANNLKGHLYSSNFGYLINKSKELLIESNKEVVNEKELTNYPENIFIVGMPRSGSTLLESILSMNIGVDDLGEINILEKSFLNWKTPTQKSTLAELYLKQTNIYSSELRITTNKWLYNYQYGGIIARHIPNAKIIHCYRNPLDNILSIYRANFAKGNQYSSSLIDCAKVYLDQEEVMTQYKKRFRAKIYDLNYDSLVSNPNQVIKSLITWLGWKWDNQYLSPHINPRSVSTASSVQVRSPINSQSIGGWKNYKDMLKPAIEILIQTDKYQDIISKK